MSGSLSTSRPDAPESRPIRVAMLIQGYYPAVGGAERQLAALAPRLQELGVRVHVLTRRMPGLESFEIVDGVPVHRLPCGGPKAIKSLTYTMSALAFLRRLRPDLIHVHDLYSPATTALAAKWLFGTPVVAKIPRGGPLGDLARLRSRRLGARRIAWLRRQVDRFVVISREIESELEGIGVPGARRILIPNGVDTAHFAPVAAEQRSALRRHLDLPETPIVVYTGRLAPEKRLEDLVAIWPEVRARHPAAQLLLIGSGDQRAALARVAGEGVRFVGPVLDVAPYLQAADLFVLPSSAEGLSNSLLEAMSTALPCVATAVGGGPELLDGGEAGRLVPPGDTAALGRAVLSLLDEPARRSALGRRARERIETHYSLSAVAERFPELYRDLVMKAC